MNKSDRQKLEEYSSLCNDEFGEACNLLIELSRYDYALSPEFVKALKKEIKDKLHQFKEEAEIVEEEETYTRTWKTLKWKDQDD